jgi:hypothetical protein
LSAEDVIENHPLRLLDQKTGLPEAELGIILARSGVGKSAALINFALDSLLKGEQVLHFCAGMASEKVHEYYREIYTDFTDLYCESKNTPWDELDRHLMVISYLDAEKMIADLDSEVETIHEGTKLSPRLIVVDGLDFDEQIEAALAKVKGCAQKHKSSLLASVRIHRDSSGEVDIEKPCATAASFSDHIYFMEPAPEQDRVKFDFMVDGKIQELPLYFDPHKLIFRKS